MMPQSHRDTEKEEKKAFLDNVFSLFLWLCGSVALWPFLLI
jgi:hypothetical protein